MGGSNDHFLRGFLSCFLTAFIVCLASCRQEDFEAPDTFGSGTPVTLRVIDAEWVESDVARSSYSDAVGIRMSQEEDIALFYSDGTKLVGVDDSNRYPFKATANGDGTWAFSNPAAAEGKTWFSLIPYSQQSQRYMKSSTNLQTRVGPVQFPLDDSFGPQDDVLAGRPFTVAGDEATINSFKRLLAPWRILVTGLESSEMIYAATLTLSGTAADYSSSIAGIMTVSTSETWAGTAICGTTGGNTRSISVQYGSGLPYKGTGHPLWFMVHPVAIPAGTTLTLKVTTADATYTRTAYIPSVKELRTDMINTLTFNIKGADYIKEESTFQDFTKQALTAGSKALTAADGSSLTWTLPASPQWTAAAKDGGSLYPNSLLLSKTKSLTIPTISGKNVTGVRLFIHPAMTWSGGGTITVKEGATEKATVDGACLVTAKGIQGAIERGGYVDIPLPDGSSSLAGMDLLMNSYNLVVSGAILFTEDSSSPGIVSTCAPWNDFVSGSPSNVLPDFSYAGYDHGRSAPPNVWSLGYEVFNICDYGAVPNDGLSDRAAVVACISAALGGDPVTSSSRYLTWDRKNSDVNRIIYFPAGEYILYEDSDKVDAGDGYYDSPALRILAGNFILKGAGRGTTRIIIADPLLPTNHDTYSNPSVGMYSSSPLFYLGGYHTDSVGDGTSGAQISSNASKGDFSAEVSSFPQTLSAGDRVCLRAHIEDSAYISEETASLTLGGSWDINVSGSGAKTGLYLREYHEIASIAGNTVTFREPLMHDIDSSYDFYIPKFQHRSGVGVEDITFVGGQANDFVHHGGWADDGAYKPLCFYFLADSWVRRCGFENCSEIASMNHGANNCMYDITLSGWRGHNNARLVRQSFSFVGKVTDTSSGKVWTNNPVYAKDTQLDGAGSFHGPGVAVESCGNVFWHCSWGKDAGFESHGSQSRCTLFDCCQGGFMSRRQGGGTDDMPNHLGGLVFWNFNALNAWADFDWWSSTTMMYVVKPILVGMHGSSVTSVPAHVSLDDSNGTAVDIESLYEAQLQLRLGSVPGWLNELK